MRSLVKYLQLLGRRFELAFAYARARAGGAAPDALIPPGRLFVPGPDATGDQKLFLKQAEKHGPISKVLWGGKITTCIVGHERALRFIDEATDKQRAASPDLRSLFPIGFLRAMEGEPHRKYRHIMLGAFMATSLEAHDIAVRKIIRNTLGVLAGASEPPVTAIIRQELQQATTAVFMRLIFGIDAGDPGFAGLVAAYEKYAPDRPFKVVREKHKLAFDEIRAKILRHVGKIRAGKDQPPSLLNHLVQNDLLDDTVLGNLIQMIAASRSDVRGLWVWIIKMLSSSPDTLAQLRDGPQGNGERGFAKAVVEETLRMEQIEALHRVATSDIVFDGYFIAKGSHVRLCLWEGHKDQEKFPDPFKFDPTRFTRTRHMIDSFAPFGMGKHRCPGADWTLDLSAIFVEELARGYQLDLVADGPAVLGGFHFEPNPNFAVALHRLRETQQATVP